MARTLSSEAYRELVLKTTPLGRIGTAELLADAIVGTLRMQWVTGQAVIADGGTHLITPRSGQRMATTGGAFRADTRKEPAVPSD